jgi:hypothetical protein
MKNPPLGGFFLFVEQFGEVQELFLFIIVAFVVEAFGEFLQRCLDDPVVRQGFEIGSDGWNGNAFEIAFHILMCKDLTAGWVDKELDTLHRAELFGVLIVIGFYISEDELPWNIDSLYRDVQQFAEQEVEDTIGDGVAALCLDEFVDEKLFGVLVGHFGTFQTVVVVQDACNDVYLFERREVTIELEPDVAAEFFHFLQYGRCDQFGVLEFCHEQGGRQEVLIAAVLPMGEIFRKIVVVEFVYQHFDPFLDVVADGILPKVLKVGYNAPSIADDAAAHGVEDFEIWIIDQVKKCCYFSVFLHAVLGFSRYKGKIGEVYKSY